MLLARLFPAAEAPAGGGSTPRRPAQAAPRAKRERARAFAPAAARPEEAMSADADGRRRDRRIGPVPDRGPAGGARGRALDALRRAQRRLRHRRARRRAHGLPAAPRPRPPHQPLRDQLPREHLGPEAAGRHAHRLDLGRRLDARGRQARRLRRDRPVLRPHAPPAGHLLRRGLRGARDVRRPGLRRGAPRAARRGPGAGPVRARRRHLHEHGGPAVLHARRVAPLPQLGHRRDRHDQPAGGQARARGRDLLRHHRHGDRLRLLARERTRTSRSRRSWP